MMEKIGLLGGTFDPVHDGHLQLALAAKNELLLDKVLLIPAAGPPHKSSEDVTAFGHRREMLLRALSGVEGLEPCFIEGNLPTPSYTIDTIRLLQARDRDRIEYYFIIGVDAFADLLSWKSYMELLRRVTLIVARRKGFTDTGKLINIADTLGYRQTTSRWYGTGGLRDICFLESSPCEISSSRIRDLLASGCREVAGVKRDVLEYIRQHNLYAAHGTATAPTIDESDDNTDNTKG